MKLTVKEKLIIAKEHVDKGVPIHELAKKYNYSASNLKYYFRLYIRYGDKGFQNHNESRCYTREEKLKVIDRVVNGKESTRAIALDMMLTDPKIVQDWVRKYKNEGEASIKDTHSRSHYVKKEDRERIKSQKKILERLNYLEIENEYLKKSYALIQKREQQGKKK